MNQVILDTTQECKLTLETPIKKLETNRYMVFAKADGENHIEVNDLSFDEILDFANVLEKIIRDNRDKIENL